MNKCDVSTNMNVFVSYKIFVFSLVTAKDLCGLNVLLVVHQSYGNAQYRPNLPSIACVYYVCSCVHYYAMPNNAFNSCPSSVHTTPLL